MNRRRPRWGSSCFESRVDVVVVLELLILLLNIAVTRFLGAWRIDSALSVESGLLVLEETGEDCRSWSPGVSSSCVCK